MAGTVETVEKSPSDPLAVLREQAVGRLDMSGRGLADVIWHWEVNSKPLALGEAWAAVVGAFQELATVDEWPEIAESTVHGVSYGDGVAYADAVAYAVSEILSRTTRLALTASDATDRETLAAFAWWVACAWSAVLAGDIDEIAEHVLLESDPDSPTPPNPPSGTA